MTCEDDGCRDVKFSVGGVELDFEKVIKAIEQNFDIAIEERARKIVNEKFDNLLNIIDDVTERVSDQTEMFKYNWE